ncbi:MAG: acylneuraminate cytidylyltransferase [Candidatus Marinimicrobia bacterium]|nr:acylneuraminate cytidylyltransferase [Candidatus Neomarinimicrobiota bacterium]|tara:strand:+ start:1209 stop:1904 length:696 start_codon:yes stop_codon:yes gene_type:complete
MSLNNLSKQTLTIIPARGGSKRIKNKNTKKLLGKSLINWTIESALKSKYVNRVIVSTDNKKISNEAKRSGIEVPFLRPPKLSTDKAKSIDLVLHAIKNIPGYEWILLLQPTSPLRTSKDIDNIFKLCFKKKALSVVSVCSVNQHPYKMFTINKNLYLKSLIKKKNKDEVRQNLPKTYITNGALYLVNISWLKKRKKFIDFDTIGYEMPPEKSVDIDTLNDWYLAENILKMK